MNYIKQLQIDNVDLIRGIKETEEALNSLRRYLNSSKFHCGDALDGYVNVNDVLARLPIL